MYFNTQIISILVAATSSMASTCNNSVQQASDNGFFEFALKHCVPSASSSANNIIGSSVLDPQECLVTFNSKTNNPGPYPIDFTNSRCRNAYTTFVSTINGMSDLFTATSNQEMCEYDSTNEELKISYNCWFRINGNTGGSTSSSEKALIVFQNSVSMPIVSGACDASDLRKISTTDWFTTNLKNMYSNTTPTDYTVCDGIPNLHCIVQTTATPAGSEYFVHPYFEQDTSSNAYLAKLSVNEAMCAGCYQTLLNDLQSDYSGNTTPQGVIQNCRSDPKSDLCLGTPYMVERLMEFRKCTGYDIDFVGPVCTAQEISMVSSTIDPIPYQLFATCALNGASNSQLCGSLVFSQYMDNLYSKTDRNCYSCFTEFKAAVESLSSDVNVVNACLLSITSDECKTALKAQLDAYKECSGFDMVFESPIVPTVPGTNTTTTTNSGMISSIIGAMIVVGLSIAL